MAKDILVLLRPGFEDPAHPGRVFYCWHCALIEGVLAAFPSLTAALEIHRIAWARPRAELVDLLGERHQSLPVLILVPGERSPHQTGVWGDRAFVTDKDAILAALSERHGFPEPHP